MTFLWTRLARPQKSPCPNRCGYSYNNYRDTENVEDEREN
jgi:hypothetical protein